MEELRFQKISIPGPTLASMIQRFYCFSGDIDGLLFGRVFNEKTSNLTDDEPCNVKGSSSTFVAIITSFFCSTATTSFFDSTGRLRSSFSLLSDRPSGSILLGWFSGRRRTLLRPSMREYTVSNSIYSLFTSSLPVDNSKVSVSIDFKPCIFLLFTTPIPHHAIYTNEYRAFQYHSSGDNFEFAPVSVEIVNIGPAFRGHYSSFSPTSTFPTLPCHLRGSVPSMADVDDQCLNQMKRDENNQKELDVIAEGFPVQNLSRLVGAEVGNYTLELEKLYKKMIAKLEILAHRVEKTSVQVSEMENRTTELRSRDASSN